MRSLLNQVSLPPSDSGPGDLWSAIVGPLAGPLSGAWWVVVHMLFPAAIILGIAGVILAGVTGNKGGMVRARGVLISIPVALFLAVAAVIISNWVIGAYT